MRTRIVALALVAAASTAMSLAQGFTDTFDTIDPAWTTDRYAPAGFAVENFDGGNRLRIDISSTDSYQNRPAGYQDVFYNTQGKQRSTSVATAWEVSGDVYVSNDMLDGANLRRTDLWARDSASEALARYPIMGIVRNNAADPFNENAALTTRWRIWDDNAGNWIDLSNPVTSGWHHLGIVSTGLSFEYSLDNSLVYTDNTTSAPGFSDLQTVFVQAYNFGDATHNPGQSYSVYWDNIHAGPVPEPASLAALGLGAIGVIRRRRARKA